MIKYMDNNNNKKIKIITMIIMGMKKSYSGAE